MRTKGEGTYGFDDAKGLYWWRIRVEGQSIVRKSKTPTGLKVKVRKALAELEATGKAPDKSDRAWSVEGWLNEWLDVYVKPNRRPSTYRFYEQMTRLYVVPVVKGRKLRDLTQADCQRVVNRVTVELGLEATTAHHARAVLIRGLKKAAELGIIRRNPATSTAPIKVSESTRRSIPIDDAPKVMAESLRTKELKTRPGEFVLAHRDGPLIAFMLSTGARIGEALGLKVVDLNLRANTVRIERNLDRDGGWWNLAPTKSRKARRTVPLSKDGLSAIHAQLRLLEGQRTCYTIDNGFLFADATGDPLSERNVQRSLDSILTAAGLPHYSLHELRHTFGSILASSGVPIHVLQALLGHESSATTARFYLHAFQDDMADAVEKIRRNV